MKNTAPLNQIKKKNFLVGLALNMSGKYIGSFMLPEVVSGTPVTLMGFYSETLQRFGVEHMVELSRAGEMSAMCGFYTPSSA